MKIPMPEEAKVAMTQAATDMTAMREELAEIKELLKILISVQFQIAGLDSPPDL